MDCAGAEQKGMIMRRLVTLILVIANVVVISVIYSSWKKEQESSESSSWLSTKEPEAYSYTSNSNSSDSTGKPSGSNSSGATAKPSGSNTSKPGPHYFTEGTSPVGTVSLGKDSSASPSPGAEPSSGKKEKPAAETKRDYGTEDPDTLSRFQEFDWYVDEVMVTGVPAGAKSLTDLSEILGSYHAYVLYDPYNSTGYKADMLGDVLVDAGQNDLVVNIDWTYIYYHKNEAGKKDDTQSVFRGSFEDGKLSASGPGNLSIDVFYKQNGRTYACGTMETTDGTPAFIALVKQ